MQFVQGLFGGNTAEKRAQAAADQERELTRITQAQQRQQAQDNAAQTAGQLAGAKQVRGQRLLLSKESSGLATTLGAA